MDKEQPTCYAPATAPPLNQARQVYPQPEYPSGPPQQQGFATVAVSTTPQVPILYGPHSQPTVCPYCHKEIRTRVVSTPSVVTHQMAVLLCIFCCMPCIPYCVDSCQNRNHYCPNCDAFLGTYSSMPMTGRLS